ncbi:hypothetical protein UK14_30085 [Streptomyces sp. NRRL F-4428]|nr:hypothetical protein UK14_30085 [Streptomyces sp. NRRL F-4428]
MGAPSSLGIRGATAARPTECARPSCVRGCVLPSSPRVGTEVTEYRAEYAHSCGRRAGGRGWGPGPGRVMPERRRSRSAGQWNS